MSTTKTGAVVAKKVALATVVLMIDEMPEEKVAGEGGAGQHGGAAERRPRGDAGLPVLQPHPGVEHRQGEGDAPEGAGEGPDIGGREAHEDRRDPHGDRRHAQSREGAGEAGVEARCRIG